MKILYVTPVHQLDMTVVVYGFYLFVVTEVVARILGVE